MALPNYPNNPSVNDTFVNGGVTFQWDGEKWKALSNANNTLTAQLADPDSTVLIGGVEAGAIAEREVTPEQFGAVGDGVADDTQAILSMLDSADGEPTSFGNSTFKTVQPSPLPTDWESGNIEIFDTNVNLSGNQKAVSSVTQPDKGFLHTHATTDLKPTHYISDLVLTQVDSSDPGGGGSNNHAMLRDNGSRNTRYVNNQFKTSSLGIRFGYQFRGTTDNSQGTFGLAAFNYFENVEKQCIENIASAYNRLVGNAVRSDRLNSNAIRLTGFDNNNDPYGRNSECLGVVGAANVIVGGDDANSAGISAQATTKYCNFSAMAILGTSFGIATKDGSVSPDGNPKFNKFDVVLNANQTGIENEGGEHSVFDVVINAAVTNAFRDITPASAGSTAGKNVLRGVIKSQSTTVNRPVHVLHDGYNFDLIVDETNTSNGDGSSVRLEGNSYSGNITVFNSPGSAFTLSGDNSNMSVKTEGSAGTSTCLLNGSNNSFDVNIDNRCYIQTGSNNSISGYAGEFRVDSDGNSFSGSADSVDVRGSNNVVTVQSTGRVDIRGDNNVVMGRADNVVFDAASNNNKFIGIANISTDNGTGNTLI